MKYSVVIAAYNASSTIAATVNACLAQSLLPCEIIVVDDASTDDTVQILQQLNQDIIVVKLTKNSGVSAARNAGWAAASGHYIAFCDSDDIWHFDKLFWIDTIVKQHLQQQVFLNQFSTDSTILKRKLETVNTKILPFGQLLLRNKCQGSCIVVNALLPIRFDEQMRYSEDYDFALQCAYRQPLLFLDAPLTLLSRPQQSIGGLSAHHWQMRKGELRSYWKAGRLNLLFLPLIPFLIAWSLLKHLVQRFA